MIANDDYELMVERAEKAEAERDALTKARDKHIGSVAGMRHIVDAMTARAEKAEAERDALLNIVAAADAMRDDARGDANWESLEDYDKARAALKEGRE